MKLGTIIRPFEYSPFRFGLAIHTPIWYTLTDRYTATLTSNIANEGMPTASYFENYQNIFILTKIMYGIIVWLLRGVLM